MNFIKQCCRGNTVGGRLKKKKEEKSSFLKQQKMYQKRDGEPAVEMSPTSPEMRKMQVSNKSAFICVVLRAIILEVNQKHSRNQERQDWQVIKVQGKKF